MSSVALEAYLAQLYTDATTRRRFNADPHGEAMRAGLAPVDCQALVQCDRVGLEMAAESFGHKRAQHRSRRVPLYRRTLRWFFTS
jgi:hypothetical protein